MKRRNQENGEDKHEMMNTEGPLVTAARDEDKTHHFIRGGANEDEFEKEVDNVSDLLKKMK